MKNDVLVNFSVDKENKKINVERTFEAPLEKVWAAFTQKEILDQWWAPKPWKTQTRSLDFTKGGHWLYAMVGPEGETHWCRADFKSIDPLKNFSVEDAFCDENGNINHGLPTSLWANEFNEDDGSTVVSIELVYGNLDDLEKILEMGFKEGFASAMENLDALLAA